jgi:hypothetical protein
MWRSRRGRVLLLVWLLVAFIVWNGVYDIKLAHGVRWYLMRTALHDAGIGLAVDLRNTLHEAVLDAVWKATAWALFVLGAGILTLKMLNAKMLNAG